MHEPSSQPQTPARSWRASLPEVVVQELRHGRDTVAGIAHRYGLPVQTILQCMEQAIQWSPNNRSGAVGEEGITPSQSRFAGMC